MKRILLSLILTAILGCSDDDSCVMGGGGHLPATEHHHGEGFPDPGHFHGTGGDSTHVHGNADPDGGGHDK